MLFSTKYLDSITEEEKLDLLFRFIQYVERQIVLLLMLLAFAFSTVK
jgi:phosphoenolpyruvate carboxylase